MKCHKIYCEKYNFTRRNILIKHKKQLVAPFNWNCFANFAASRTDNLDNFPLRRRDVVTKAGRSER